MNKQQANQAKNLQTAKRQLQAERADLKSAILLIPDAKLSGAEKRRLTAAVKKAKQDGKIPRTAQQTIPYREMFRDGICAVTNRYFTKQGQPTGSGCFLCPGASPRTGNGTPCAPAGRRSRRA